MKKELYDNYLLVKYLFLTMEQVNSLEEHEKEYYINDIKRYLEYKKG